MIFNGQYVVDTLEPVHVWETHMYYPQFWVPESAVNEGFSLTKSSVGDDDAAYVATLKVGEQSSDRVLGFKKGPLAGLIRFEFHSMRR